MTENEIKAIINLNRLTQSIAELIAMGEIMREIDERLRQLKLESTIGGIRE